MNQQPAASVRPRSPWRRRLFIGAIAAGSGIFIWSRLPKGAYPTDLSPIGQGQAALVLTMDGNFMGGAEMMKVLNGVRPDFASSVHFLVASMGLPEGRAFARQHQAGDGTVVLFDAGGRRLAVLHAPQTADELRQAIQQALGR